MSPRVAAKSVAVVAAAASSMPLAFASPLSATHPSSIFKRDPPPALPECATEGDLKWQPVFDFDTDSCYNVPAVGADGTVNPGLDECDTTVADGCRDESDLDNNNVYVRARCNNGWCGHLYGYYFEKDVAVEHSCGSGHRHDWEHVVVWVEQSTDSIRYVAASAHGGYDTRAVEDIMMDGDRAKIVYHKDGGSTHAMRFAKEDDDAIENAKGVWFRGALVSYEGFPNASVRDAMMGNDWGKGKIDFSDARFADALESAKGKFDIPLDTSTDDESSPGVPSC